MTFYAAKACGCFTNQVLQQSQFDLAIVDAEKHTTEKSTGTATHVVYTIRFQGKEAKRRYRDFDSFRTALTQLYPDVLVPPIPGKHSLTDYANLRDRKDDALIEKRKRMLLRFLTHLAAHPRLRHEHVFHQFLDGSVLWSEVMNSSPISTLSKEGDSAKYLLGSAGALLQHATKEPDPQFADTESLIEAHAQFATSKLDRTQQRLSRRLGEISMDYSELGRIYDTLNLHESGQFASDIKRIALATSSTQLNMAQLVHSLEIDFMEHMHEYVQYTQIAKDILHYRRSKRAQLELIQSTLESKSVALESLLKTEDHAVQIEAALSSGKSLSTLVQIASSNVDSDIDTRSIEDDFAAIDIHDRPSSSNGGDGSEYPPSASASAIRASRDRYKKWASPRKLLDAMSSTLQGMIDVDPEATRRNQIGKLQRRVAELQTDLTSTEQELETISENIQHELNDFKRKRTVELRAMMIAYAKIHLQYCEESARIWQDARQNLELP